MKRRIKSPVFKFMNVNRAAVRKDRRKLSKNHKTKHRGKDYD